MELYRKCNTKISSVILMVIVCVCTNSKVQNSRSKILSSDIYVKQELMCLFAGLIYIEPFTYHSITQIRNVHHCLIVNSKHLLCCETYSNHIHTITRNLLQLGFILKFDVRGFILELIDSQNRLYCLLLGFENVTESTEA